MTVSRRCSWLPRLCLVLATGLSAAPLLAQNVTEFRVLPSNTSISPLLNYRGRLWFLATSSTLSASGAPYITILKTDGTIQGQFLAPGDATDLAVGSDANLWFTDGGRLGRIDLTGSVFTRFPTQAASQPVAGTDGAIWFVEQSSSSYTFLIARLERDGSITELPLPASVDETYPLLSPAPDGAWWILLNSGFSGQIARMTAAGVVTAFDVTTEPCQYVPTGLAVGSDGAAWFTESPAGSPFESGPPCDGQPGKIGRITYDGAMTEYALDPNAVGYPYAIIAGPAGGALWFATYGSYNSPNPGIGRISTAGDITVSPLSGVVDSVGSMTFGPDGNIWFTNGVGDGKIYRFAVSPGASCIPDENTLCLDHGRFRVQAAWEDAQGGAGTASVVDGGMSNDSGLLWFFDPGNWELLIKVLDGCEVNGDFWVYGAASTDVQYTVQVTDTKAGRVWTYTNPLGTRSPAITDSAALASCP